ncbi:ATP-dependent helicase, partial [Citrobacter freundii]
ANDPNRQTTIAFQLCPDGLGDQAVHAVEHIIPAALAAKPGRTLGDIAILYKDYHAGDIVADAVTTGGFDYIRVDTAAPYRKVALTSWVEDCAAWCAGG